MGLTHTQVVVSNLVTRDSFTANFLIDTGATDSMAPASLFKTIGVEPIGRRVYELANGQMEDYEVGDARLAFLEEIIPMRLIFGPDDSEPILGVIALEAAGLVVDPTNQSLKRLPARPLK